MDAKERYLKKYEESREKICNLDRFVQKHGHSEVTDSLIPIYERDAETYWNICISQ